MLVREEIDGFVLHVFLTAYSRSIAAVHRQSECLPSQRMEARPHGRGECPSVCTLQGRFKCYDRSVWCRIEYIDAERLYDVLRKPTGAMHASEV